MSAPWNECRHAVVLKIKHSKYLTAMENTLKATIKKKKKRYLIGYLMVILLWALTRRLCVCVSMCVGMLIHTHTHTRTHLFSLLSAHFITPSRNILQFIDKSRKEETNSGLNSLIVTNQPTETACQSERAHMCRGAYVVYALWVCASKRLFSRTCVTVNVCF